MSFVKTPTSSLSLPKLLSSIVWYRGKATFKQLVGGITPELSTNPPSPIARLPYELVETIISYLTYDLRALRACSMTCRLWWNVTLPHLYYYLTADNWDALEKKRWPTPLQSCGKFKLLPFVKQLCLRNMVDFTPQWLEGSTFRYFSALTNLQELGIDSFDIPKFMPNIQRYFGHFVPTLRFLALKAPEGSCRQVLYFIGLFPNLRDLKICSTKYIKEKEDHPTLIPQTKPPLDGRLTLACFEREDLAKDMVTLFDGLRFRYMNLFGVNCVGTFLGACTETLETLRLYPTDLYRNNESAASHFNLSQNRALRTLETTAVSITNAENVASAFFKTVLPTITSPLPLNVVIVHRGAEFGHHGRDLTWRRRHHPLSAEEKADICSKLAERFVVFREMYSVRKFRLVLCADVHASTENDAKEMLEHVWEEERRRGGDDFSHGVSIISDRIPSHIRFCGPSEGDSSTSNISASAL